MGDYGNKGTTAPHTGTSTNFARECVYPAMTENGWAYEMSILMSRTTATAAWARLLLNTLAGDDTPGPLLANTAEMSVIGLGSYGGDLETLTGPLTAVVPLSVGEQYAAGYAARGGEIIHGMVAAASLPAAYDEQFYVRASVGSTGPYNPFGDTSNSAQGHIRVWVTYESNVKPNVPVSMAPFGLLSTAPSAFTGWFRDGNETVGPLNIANPAEKMLQYKIQLRETVSGVILWDDVYNASGGEQTARAFSIAYDGSGTLAAGTSYEWRAAVSDAHGEFSNWSPWYEFQIGSAGIASIQSLPGVSGRIITQTPTGFAVSYSHPTALSTSQKQLQILENGVVIRDTTIAAVHASGSSFTIDPVWGGGGLVALDWSKTLTWRWRAYDSSPAPTAWSAEVPFNTNYRPSTPSNLSPSGGAVAYGYPLLTFTMSDLDDTVTTGLYSEVRIKTNAGALIATRNATLKSGSSTVWEYQTNGGDLSATGTYKWDVRGRDANLDGNYSTETSFFYAESPVITSPQDGDLIPANEISIAYSINGQLERRFLLVKPGTETILVNTNWEVLAGSGTFGFDWDVSALLPNGTPCDLIVEVELSGAIVTRTRISNLTLILDPVHSVSIDEALSGAIMIGSEVHTTAIKLRRDELVGIDENNFEKWLIKEADASWYERWNGVITPLPEPYLMLPLDGTLTGQDRAGVLGATGTGGIRYTPVGRKNYMINARAANNTTGWSGVTRVIDPDFINESNPTGTCFEITSAASNVGAIKSAIPWPFGTGATLSFDVKWMSGDQNNWYFWVSQSGVGNSGGILTLLATLDGVVHRVSTSHANLDNFANAELNITRGPGGGIVTTSTIRVSNIVVEEGTVGGPPAYIKENYWLEHWGSLGTAHAAPICEDVAAFVEDSETNLLPYGSFRDGANAANPSNWSVQSGTANNRDWGPTRFVEWNISALAPSPLFYAGPNGYAAVTPGTAYTFSVWVYNSMSTSRGFNLGMFWYDAAKAVTTGPDISSFTLAAGEARRVSMTATAPASRTWVRPQIQATTSAAVSDRFILKEAQVEVGTYATTPIPQFNGSGVLLTGYTYSGAAHTTTSARAASAIDVDSLNHINTEEGTVLFRFNPGASVDSFEAIFRAGNPSEDTIQFRRNGTNAWTFGNRNIAGWSEIYWSETINTSVLCHIEWSGFGAVCRMRIDGGTWRTVVSPKIMSNLATQDIFFGRFSNNSIRDAIIFDRVLTDDEYTRVVTPLLADTLEWDDMGPTDYARWLSEAIALAYELETVAESTSFEAMELTYFEPRLGRTQTYAMTAVIRDGVNTIESFPVNPVQLTCDMYGTVVSDISDPVGRRIYLDFMTDSDTKKLDNDTLIDTWDESNLPVVVVGSSEYRTFGGQFRLVANDTFPPVEQRTMLESMKGVRSDDTPIIVCIRDDMGDRIIGRLDAVDGKRGDSFGEIVVNLTVIETQHD